MGEISWKHSPHYHCPACGCQIDHWRKYFYGDAVNIGGCPRCPRIMFECQYRKPIWIMAPDKYGKTEKLGEDDL